MTLEVILNAYLSSFLPSYQGGQSQTRSRFIEFKGQVTAEVILNQWAIPLQEVSVITCNGQRIEIDTPITSNGVIIVYPSLIGG